MLRRKAEDDSVYHARPLIFAFGLCLGAAIYLILRHEPSIQIVAICWFTALSVLIISYRHFGSLTILISFVVFAVASGLVAGKSKALRLPGGTLLQETRPIMLEGWILGIEPGAKSNRLRLSTHAVEGMDAATRPKAVRVTHRASITVYPGQFVRCRVVLRPPPGPSIPGDYDFRRQAWFQGLHAVGYVQGRCRAGVLGIPNNSTTARRAHIASLRRGLAEYAYEAAGPRSGGFAAALTSGDRSFMREEDRVALREAGLAHLLAISGLHIGIVCGLVYLIVFRSLARWEWLAIRMPLQKPAAVMALIAGGLYLVVSGASVSTQRAFIMASLVFTAVLIDRQAISLRTFSIAMIAIIIMQPDSVLSPGFQMSFAATGILIAVYEAWREHRLSMPRGFGSRQTFAVKSLFVTSIAAGIATAPYAFYHFDRIAPYGLAANLLAMPIVSFVTAPVAAISILLAPFGLADYGLRLFGWSLEWVLAIAHWNQGLNESSGPQWKAMPDYSLLLFSAAIGSFILQTGKLRQWSVLLLSVCGFVVWFTARPPVAYWSPSGEVFVRIDDRYQRISFADGEGLAPLSFKSLKTTGYCRHRRCLIEFEHGALLLAEEIDASTCKNLSPSDAVLAIKNAPSTCSTATSFDVIQNTGGAAIWISREGTQISYAASCGARLWQPECDER